MKAVVIFVVLCVYGCVIYSASAAAQDESQSQTWKPLVIVSGADSHVGKPSLELAITPEEWKQVWVTHLGSTVDNTYLPEMKVDFDRCMAVAIFRGPRTNVSGIQIDSTSDIGEAIRIRINEVTYQTEGKDNNNSPAKPYAFIVLPKSGKKIVVEENVQQYKGHPPEWKEWARVEGHQATKPMPKDARANF